MSRGLATELYSVAARIFEEIAFLFPASPDEEPDAGPATVATSVAFAGPFSGQLVLSVPEELLRSIASNMLGEDEAPSRQQQLDALGELANVICGNVLPRLAGAREEFALSAPAPVDPAPLPRPSAEARLALSEGRAELRLFLGAAVGPDGAGPT